MLGGLDAKVRVCAALDDGEEGLGVSVQGLRLPEALVIALKPALREAEGFGRILAVCVSGAAFVQGHHYVCAYDTLGVYVVFRREEVAGAVYVRLELAAFLRNLADAAEAEYLEAAAVCEDGAVPAFKLVEAAGTEVQVIGVAENDLRLDVFLKVPVVNTFH